jgi:hypothetical protein
MMGADPRLVVSFNIAKGELQEQDRKQRETEGTLRQ